MALSSQWGSFPRGAPRHLVSVPTRELRHFVHRHAWKGSSPKPICTMLHLVQVLRRIRPHRTLRAQTSDHYLSRTGIRRRSSPYAAPCQDADMGGGVGGVWPPVHDERYGLPDMGVYISRVEGRNMGLGPQGRREPAPRLRRRSRPLRRCAIEHALPSPGLADLRLDLDRYTRTFGTGSVEHFIHPVDHGCL